MKRVFNSTITISNDVIRDHQVHGQSLLPGLAYVDMIYQLAQQAAGIDFRAYFLSDVAISNPLRVSQDRPVDVAISFEEVPSGWNVTIDGRERGAADSPIKRYASAALQRQSGVSFDDSIDIASFKNKASRHVDMEQIYAEARTRGLVHRGSIKAEGIVYVNGSGGLAEVCVSEDAAAAARYLIHPALLDGSAMASTAVGMADNAVSAGNGQKLYIPLHYESFACTERLNTSCYSLVRLAPFQKGSDIRKMDIDFYDAGGRQIAALRGLANKAIRHPDQIRAASDNSRQTLARIVIPVGGEVGVDGTADTGTIERVLRRVYSPYLHMAPSELDLDTGFFDLGFESSQLLAVLKDTEKAFGISLSPTLLFEESNLRGLIEHIRKVGGDVPKLGKRLAEVKRDSAPRTFVFSENEPFLRDHLVFGEPALMGVTHPCLVLECSSIDRAKPFRGALRNIQFAGGPITLKKGDCASIRVKLSDEDGQTHFSTDYFISDPAEAKVCCSGELIREVPARQPRVAIDRIVAESTPLGQKQIDKFYTAVKDFTIGPMLRVIETAHLHRDSTLVLKVCLKDKLQKGNVSRFLLDPLLLNACYYLLDEGATPRAKIFVPLFVESLTLFRPMTETAFVVTTVRVRKDNYVAFDAMVFTEDGECIAEVINASLKEVERPESLVNSSFVLPAVTERERPNSGLDVAIVGLAGRYPQGRDVQAFWQALQNGKDCITEIPGDRWDWREYFSDDRTKPGSMYSKWGGFIEDMDRFDPRFFGISPREAEIMDPQERLFLEHAWMALEDAGYTRQKLQAIGAPELPGNVGVYVGVMSHEYPLFAAEAGVRGGRFGVGSNTSSIANRVSFVCDLHGPSMTIDTMCSSSLTAIETASRALAEHRIDAALAGGVNITIHPNKYLMLSQGQFISSKGRCESFGEGGDGYIPGEGVGVLFLKRLSDAERDGDHIYAVIKGAALNHGGRAGGYTVPNPKAQSRVIARALKESGIHPETISYIEAHGTGTKLGDPVEIAGLSAAYGELTDQKQFCWLGSVKSNIGHCESAAGVAGITKVLLQMQHRKIAPSLHSEAANPTINFGETPFVVNHVLREWDRPVWNGRRQPRRAGVSSFGAGGSNAHIILEEYDSARLERLDPVRESEEDFLIVLSAKREDGLRTIARNLHTVLSHSDGVVLDRLAYTLQTGREAMEFRLAMPVQSLAELKSKLQAFLENRPEDGVFSGDIRRSKDTLGLFGDDEDVGQLVETWMARKKYKKVLEFWVKGGTVDWSKLYPDHPPRRLSLPVYPFARERYWLPINPPVVEAKTTTEASHPPVAVAPRENESAGLPLMTFREVWQEEALPAARESANPAIRTLVCFLSNSEYRRIFLENIQSVAPACHVAFLSKEPQFKRVSSNAYDVPAGDSELLQRAFNDIRQDFGEIDAIVYLWALDDPSLIRDSAPIVHSIQAIAAAKIKPALLLLGGLFKEQLDRCHLESWVGFERSLKLLLPALQVNLVHGDGPADGFLADLVAEVHRGERRSVLYRDGRRHVCEIVPASPGEEGDPILRTRGTYVLTGGFGSLGFIFAKHLAKRYQANLVLIGRSSLDGGKKEKLDELKKLGAQPTYLEADVANESALGMALAEVRARFGSIHGIIHAAGYRGPKSILDKDIAEFRSVLAAKVQGTLALDRLFASEPLDFVCYFSSIAATLGDFGSCDYAIGNRFQIAYARHRNQLRASGDRQGVAIVVSWPQWTVGGLGFADDDRRKMYLKSSGQRLLETDEGIETFERILKERREECMVLAGDPERIHRFLGLRDREAIPARVTSALEPSFESAITPPVGDRVIEDLKKCVGDILKIPPVELDADENWAGFGFDSVTLTEFAATLTKRCGFEINPVQFYSHPSIESLANFILTERGGALPPLDDGETTPKPATSPVSPPIHSNPQSARPDSVSVETPHKLEPIAIIGVSGRFPKCRSVQEMWQVLADGQDTVEEIPADRFDWRQTFGNPAEDASKTNGKWCGCIPGVLEFDPLFFEISPREAEAMDPRQRLLLMEAWKALEDAGYGRAHLARNKVGMFVGVESSEHAIPSGENAGITANHDAILAGRLAYFLNLKGPNIAINTACSSGLVALHLASQSLRNGECETAIAAGINVLLKPDAFVLMGRAGMLSSEGKCFTFDKRANGIVPGEAVVVVVLKRLSAAERDGDPVYAVIEGSGLNYDGKTNGITAPSGVSQSELMSDIYDRSGVSPDEIEYVVTHGTATQLGDPIEVNALLDTFKTYTKRTNYCALTSNKTNFGHCMAASGLVSLVNLVEAMRHETIPASLHCETENDFISWDRSPFFVNKANKPWPRSSTKRRRGAVSSFGMSGTNAHMVVQDYPVEPSAPGSDAPAALLVLSAKSREALSRKVQDMIAWCHGQDAREFSVSQVSYTLLAGRQHFEYRCAIVAGDWEEAERLWRSLPEDHLESARQATTLKTGPELLDQASTEKNNGSRYREILSELATHYSQGHELEWDRLFGQNRPRRVHLPTYPFSRKSYGGQSVPQPAGPAAPSVNSRPKPGFDVDGYLIQLIGGHLKLTTEDLEFDKELDEYGLDSIEAATLVNEMGKTFEGIPRSLFLEQRTLADVRAFLLQNFAREIEALGDAGRAKSADAASERVAPVQPAPLLFAAPVSRRRAKSVSIIGMAGLFPGAASIDGFVDVLRARRVVTSPLPERRRHLIGLNGSVPSDDPFYGGYLGDVEYFDRRLFKLSLDEARAMDPQLRKLLEVISVAIADAGTTLRDFRSSRTGIYVATKGNSGYQEIPTPGNRGQMPAEHPGLYANRISNVLNLQGPSEVIDTGCSSFLVAVKQAVTALREGRCDQAIVAAAELALSPARCCHRDDIGLYTSRPDTRSFGADSDGYVKSEVIGAMVLKAEEDALREGAPIYANIKGVGVCHGGKAPLKWYSPNIRGQKLAIEEALADSGIDPETVMYIEAEANGSQLGDSSEMTAIQSVYGKYLQGEGQGKIRIGSLKPLVGHAENASTFTALVKLIYSMKSGRMQEVHGLNELNKGITVEDGFEILREETPWQHLHKDQEVVPRRGAVHSLAVGGVNAHLILEEPAAAPVMNGKLDRSAFVFVFSDESELKLRLLIEDYDRFLARLEPQAPDSHDLLRMEYTLQVGRNEYPYRLAVVASSLAELKTQLQAWLECGSLREIPEDPYIRERRKLNELAREWMSGKTVDWSAIRPALLIQRLNLPGNPLLKDLCWHEGLGFDSDPGRTPSIGTVFLAPTWTAKDVRVTQVQAREVARTVIFCDWSQESVASMEALLDCDTALIALQQGSTLSIERRFTIYICAIFEQVQRAIESHSTKTGKPTFVQVIVPDGVENTPLHGIAALLKTARKEDPRFTGQLIVLDPGLEASSIVSRLQDNLDQPEDVLVRYVSGERQVRVWGPMPGMAKERPTEACRTWRDGSVVLVTGGAGALGLIVARDIARHSRAATIILAGRSPLSDPLRKAADEIHSLGARLIYEQVDIAEKSQVDPMIRRILEDCGGLTDIIHCAGLVDDKSILNKTVSQVEKVLRSKVSGVWHLDDATKALPLNSFVLFSSVSGVFGNPGQADYAAGNAFMDGFSILRNHLVNSGRRQGRTIAISWPLWAEGGMAKGNPSKELLKRKHGIVPLPSDEGLRAMEHALSSAAAEVCVLYGDIDTVLESVSGGRL